MVTQQPPTLSLEEIVICTLSKFNRQDIGKEYTFQNVQSEKILVASVEKRIK